MQRTCEFIHWHIPVYFLLFLPFVRFARGTQPRPVQHDIYVHAARAGLAAAVFDHQTRAVAFSEEAGGAAVTDVKPAIS